LFINSITDESTGGIPRSVLSDWSPSCRKRDGCSAPYDIMKPFPPDANRLTVRDGSALNSAQPTSRAST